jgi:hypothetical protein
MDYSEFLRQLGADPTSQDPDFLRARDSSPEFQQAAQAADAFEAKLTRAMKLSSPDGLLDDILKISQGSTFNPSRRWPIALAAAILLSVGAVGMGWKMNHSWDSVDQYLVEHYRYDGQGLLDQSGAGPADNVQPVLSRFDVKAIPQLAQLIDVIKYCPTPDGKGVHMVLSTDEGPVTLIYMPETAVTDREMVEFDGMQAMLVSLDTGSIIIIGSQQQSITRLYSLVQNSLVSTA